MKSSAVVVLAPAGRGFGAGAWVVTAGGTAGGCGFGAGGVACNKVISKGATIIQMLLRSLFRTLQLR